MTMVIVQTVIISVFFFRKTILLFHYTQIFIVQSYIDTKLKNSTVVNRLVNQEVQMYIKHTKFKQYSKIFLRNRFI